MDRPIQELLPSARSTGRRLPALTWLAGLSLDLKLGLRMLIKYPVLTVASVLAIAVAVALAASWFEFTTDLARPQIPLEEGERLVSLRNRDLATTDRDFSGEPRSLHDFEIWRSEVTSIENLTAVERMRATVTTDDGRVATLTGARVTPSMFRLARVQPLLGRPLTEEDDRPDAPLVAVLGHSAWRGLFDGDPSAIGRTVRLGTEDATVVGVMPEGFGFPLNQEIWTPLRERPSSYGPREGPAIGIAGRLAPGVTLEQARAELAAIGGRLAAEFPETHEHLRPEARRFGRGGDETTIAVALNLPFLLFLIVVSANVATLLSARTATRRGEIALRSALGASRARIVLQLVAEAFVLTSVAATLGLVAAGWGLHRGMELFWEVQQMRPPFWWDSGLSATTFLYSCALAVVGALVIGSVPGLRTTRGQLRHRLAELGSGGSSLRFGAVATGVIVAQVALCVAFIPVTIMNVDDLLPERADTPFPAEAYLTGRLTHQLDLPGAPGSAQAAPEADGSRTAAASPFDEVRRRLAAEPGVRSVTRADRLPGFNHPIEAIEIESDSTWTIRTRMLAVDPNFFDVMEARIVDGREFRPDDVAAATPVAIVDRDWAGETFGGNPLGRRIRPLGRGDEGPGPWYEIVGVVAGIQGAIGPGTAVRVFHPCAPRRRPRCRSTFVWRVPPGSSPDGSTRSSPRWIPASPLRTSRHSGRSGGPWSAPTPSSSQPSA